jgi:hypothetical protein
MTIGPNKKEEDSIFFQIEHFPYSFIYPSATQPSIPFERLIYAVPGLGPVGFASPDFSGFAFIALII